MDDIIYLLDHYDKIVMLLLNFNGGVMMDSIWKLFSMPIIWLPIAVMFLLGLIRRRVPLTTILLVIVFLAIAIGASDFVASGIIKPYCCRLRPSHSVACSTMLHYVDNYRGGQFGFVSSHAATTFSIFTFIALLFRQKKVTYPLLLFVICICYSRIYLGVHYPGDIVCGSMIGTAMGSASYLGLVFAYRIDKSLPHYSLTTQVGGYLYYSIWVTLLLPFIISVRLL